MAQSTPASSLSSPILANGKPREGSLSIDDPSFHLLDFWGNTYLPMYSRSRQFIITMCFFFFRFCFYFTLFFRRLVLPLGSHALATFDPKHYRAFHQKKKEREPNANLVSAVFPILLIQASPPPSSHATPFTPKKSQCYYGSPDRRRLHGLLALS